MNMSIITSNPGKVKEYRASLSLYGIDAEQLYIPYDEIQTSELEEVVKKGMEYLKSQGYKNFIIDDSGMFVDELKGFPGVYSAYAQKTLGNVGLLKQMENVENRSARFMCCIGCNINGNDVIVMGVCPGTILHKEAGDDGFGYDPIFSPDGKRSFAEMELKEKNSVSHRGRAVKLLMDAIKPFV